MMDRKFLEEIVEKLNEIEGDLQVMVDYFESQYDEEHQGDKELAISQEEKKYHKAIDEIFEEYDIEDKVAFIDGVWKISFYRLLIDMMAKAETTNDRKAVKNSIFFAKTQGYISEEQYEELTTLFKNKKGE